MLELHTGVGKELFFIWPLYVYTGDFFFLQGNLCDWNNN